MSESRFFTRTQIGMFPAGTEVDLQLMPEGGWGWYVGDEFVIADKDNPSLFCVRKGRITWSEGNINFDYGIVALALEVQKQND